MNIASLNGQFSPDMWDAPEPEAEEAPVEETEAPSLFARAMERPDVVQALSNFRTIK
jgi:hypothetical protein